MNYKIRHSHTFDTNKVELHYGATFVGETCLKGSDGQWCNHPVSVFYQENPPLNYNHLFGLFYGRSNSVCITDASAAFDSPMVGVATDEGEVIYSRYRYDFASSTDGSVSIDGGRDYTRIIGNVNVKRVYLVYDQITHQLKVTDIIPKENISNRVE